MDNLFFSNYNLMRMEMYRSGHNGAHSKCVSPPGHEGSNPSISAKAPELFVFPAQMSDRLAHGTPLTV